MDGETNRIFLWGLFKSRSRTTSYAYISVRACSAISGFVATAYRDTLSTGLYFLSYHGTKRALRLVNDDDRTVSCGVGSEAAMELAAGGIAGTLAWGAVIPFDVVKTRLQAQESTQVIRCAQLTLGLAWAVE